MSTREENQPELSSNLGGNRFEHSVSQWPKHFYSSQRVRSLAYLQPLYDEKEESVNGYRIINSDREWHVVTTLDRLIEYVVSNNCDLYTSKLYSNKGNGFIWLNEILSREECTGYIANSSKQLVTLSYKVGRRKLKIINASNWLSGAMVNDTFIEAIRSVHKAANAISMVGTYASPSSLGHALLLDSMYKQRIGKIYRPSNALRNRIRQYSSGGRADDFTLEKEYHNVFERDRDNSYANTIINGENDNPGVPTGRIGESFTVGLEHDYSLSLSDIREWQGKGTSFCQARIDIPSGNKRKLSPFYVRGSEGLLTWQNEPGSYVGYWWCPMLERCIDVGYNVRIAKAWIWTELDQFMTQWVYDLINLRNQFPKKSLEEQLVKGIIVASIGRFGMSNETQTLVTAQNKQENDENWLDLQAGSGESLQTPYFVHTEVDNNANHLNQIASYIIMCNNVALTDEMMLEEMNGNPVLASNFDAYYTQHRSTLATPNWKEKEYASWRPQGRRTYDGVLPDGTYVGKHPGRKKQGETR